MDLFASAAARAAAVGPAPALGHRPLAERMRPRRLDEVVGQAALLGPRGSLTPLLARGILPSLVLWGPPGSGKTTLAQLLAAAVGADIEAVSAVLAGVRDLRAAVERAERRQAMGRRRTLLFVDEIHRFNRAQQDALLPHVEAGTVILVGATTENPSFELNQALLSRCRVLTLAPLGPAAIRGLLEAALADAERGLGGAGLAVDAAALAALVDDAGGDARRALGSLEAAAEHALGHGGRLDLAAVAAAAQAPLQRYDRDGEMHHDVVSAFIKSMRGSDPDAALYYLARMLEGGEPPRFVLRRMVIFASEDVGLADPQALPLAVAALQAFDLVGLPEGTLPLVHVVSYLACAAKSDAVIRARDAAWAAAAAHGALAPPAALRAPGGASGRAQGRAQGYVSPHAATDAFVPRGHLPAAMAAPPFLTLRGAGAEAGIAPRLAEWRRRRAAAAAGAGAGPGGNGSGPTG